MKFDQSEVQELIAELNRRRVFRVAGLYSLVGFVLIQVIANLFPVFGIPESIGTYLILLVVIGFPIALGLAWVFDITESGIVITQSESVEEKIAGGDADGNAFAKQFAWLSDFIQEMRERRVLRVMAVYGGIAFIMTEIVSNTFPALHFPGWSQSLIVILLIIGFPISIGLAWVFDITDHGIVKTESKGTKETVKKIGYFLHGDLGFAIILFSTMMVALLAWIF